MNELSAEQESAIAGPVSMSTARGDALVVGVKFAGLAGLRLRLVMNGDPKLATERVLLVDCERSFSAIVVPPDGGEQVVELEVVAGTLLSSRLSVTVVNA